MCACGRDYTTNLQNMGSSTSIVNAMFSNIHIQFGLLPKVVGKVAPRWARQGLFWIDVGVALVQHLHHLGVVFHNALVLRWHCTGPGRILHYYCTSAATRSVLVLHVFCTRIALAPLWCSPSAALVLYRILSWCCSGAPLVSDWYYIGTALVLHGYCARCALVPYLCRTGCILAMHQCPGCQAPGELQPLQYN